MSDETPEYSHSTVVTTGAVLTPEVIEEAAKRVAEMGIQPLVEIRTIDGFMKAMMADMEKLIYGNDFWFPGNCNHEWVCEPGLTLIDPKYVGPFGATNYCKHCGEEKA